MIDNLNKKNIPVILLNGRITKKTFNKMENDLKIFQKKFLIKLIYAYPQNKETKNI